MSDQIPTEDRPGQDVSLDVLRLAARTIMARPDRDLTTEESELLERVSRQFAEEFAKFDQMMCAGVFAPSDWKLDQGQSYDQRGVPTSAFLEELKAMLESRVMEYVGRLGKLGKKTGERFTIALAEILKLSGQIGDESRKITTLHNLKPDQASGGAHKLTIVNQEPDRVIEINVPDTVTNQED